MNTSFGDEEDGEVEGAAGAASAANGQVGGWGGADPRWAPDAPFPVSPRQEAPPPLLPRRGALQRPGPRRPGVSLPARPPRDRETVGVYCSNVVARVLQRGPAADARHAPPPERAARQEHQVPGLCAHRGPLVPVRATTPWICPIRADPRARAQPPRRGSDRVRPRRRNHSRDAGAGLHLERSRAKRVAAVRCVHHPSRFAGSCPRRPPAALLAPSPECIAPVAPSPPTILAAAGDSLLNAVRRVLPAVPVGKILIQRDEEHPEKIPKVRIGPLSATAPRIDASGHRLPSFSTPSSLPTSRIASCCCATRCSPPAAAPSAPSRLAPRRSRPASRARIGSRGAALRRCSRSGGCTHRASCS